MQTTGPRLLICSQAIPHPSRGASAIIFHHYIDRFRRQGYRIQHLLAMDDHPDTREAYEFYEKHYSVPGQFDIQGFWSPRLLRPTTFSYQLDTATLTPALAAAEKFSPDSIFYIDFMGAWAFRRATAERKIVWLGDLTFQTYYYHSLYATKENPLKALRLPKVWVRVNAWKKLYAEVLQDVDRVIVSSKSGEEQMRRLGVESVYRPFPFAHSQHLDDAKQPPQRTFDKPTFFFMGNLQGLGSRSAFRFLLGPVYRRLLKVWGRGGFNILIAGRTKAPEWALEIIQRTPELEFLGFVPDVEGLMAVCDAALAPIDVPVGNRTRILTAMQNKVLVIAHQNKSLGNPDLVDQETCYLARTADEFVQRMRWAVEQPQATVPLVERAHEAYQAHFAPDVASSVFLQELESIKQQEPQRRVA